MKLTAGGKLEIKYLKELLSDDNYEFHMQRKKTNSGCMCEYIW